MYSDGPFAQKQWKYPPADLSNPSSQRLKGDSGTTDNNIIAFIRNDQGADKQFKHFVPNHSSGLTLNGLDRINRSIEAFGYCILGAQANTRSSILDLSNPSSQRLKGDSGTTDNNTIAFIRNDQGADKQFEHFVPNHSSGLTLNGLGRINRSIEAFGYCILGAQANT